MRASAPLPLLTLQTQMPNSRYRAAKPCRLYTKYGKCAIQLFPRGCIQILGNVNEEDVLQVYQYLTSLIHPITLSKPQVKSCTILCSWNNNIKLGTLPSNAHISNDMELFPGSLVNFSRFVRYRVRNYHCALFHNGSAIVTGVTDIHEAERVLKQCIDKYILPHV